jgi:fibro-slime domain-containing protein
MASKRLFSLVAATSLLFAACSSSNGGNGNGNGNGGNGDGSSGSGGNTGDGGSGSGTGADGGDGITPNCEHVLHAKVRDRSPDAPDSNPDFENPNMGDDLNIVMPQLGADNTPVYAGNPSTSTTHSASTFAEWYHDLTSGTNYDFQIDLPLTAGSGGVYTYDNESYFPIDGQGYGNYKSSGHNFHFTTEVHTTFVYSGGEVFTFTGDDDLFAYIDKKLVINLGGIHSAETKSVQLDTLGLTKGSTYRLDIFGAERHTVESHFRVDTTIGCLMSPPIQ